jgi:hypothetical protein
VPGSCRYNWTVGNRVSSLLIKATADGIRATSIDGVSFRQDLRVVWSPCRFGGDRAWVICPHCSSRRLFLYFVRGGLTCRTCGKLAYTSQSEDLSDRGWRKERKVLRRLGLPDGSGASDAIFKPGGMHESTWQRHQRELRLAEEMKDRWLSAAFVRFAASLPEVF